MNSFFDRFLAFEESWSDDKRRKSYLLNFINLILLFFLGLIFLIRLATAFNSSHADNQESWWLLITVILVFMSLAFLVKKGFVKPIAFALLSLLLFAAIQGSWQWGIDLYTIDIIYPLIILLSGILLGSVYPLIFLLVIGAGLTVIFYLHNAALVTVSSSWRAGSPDQANLVTIIVVYAVMTIMSWLSSREVEKSLHKARDLAHKLRLHNLNLEKTVFKRTKELRALQLQQLMQMTPLLDLGKLTAGLVHDIRQPLSVISMVLQKQQLGSVLSPTDLNLTTQAVAKINDLASISTDKFARADELEIFDLNLELKKLIELFSYKATQEKINLVFAPTVRVQLHASRKKLMQVVANLLMNAIESYQGLPVNDKPVFIKLKHKARSLQVEVKDYGCGINQHSLEKLFQPGFSEKTGSEAVGLGLYVANEIMREVFDSQITVESQLGKGSVFRLLIKKRFLVG